ncbi:hypothetical protein B0H63DRAFT_546576 [Podospora didyma]|uniref:Uncharacterized protein n=1 Tax=Podospora didyma TaxID=330526 RepID=A0AAE0NI42_9PEZI|nr:hypothetical protein B0H63DRAFT_546576 [Podospora didyma]
MEPCDPAKLLSSLEDFTKVIDIASLVRSELQRGPEAGQASIARIIQEAGTIILDLCEISAVVRKSPGTFPPLLQSRLEEIVGGIFAVMKRLRGLVKPGSTEDSAEPLVSGIVYTEALPPFMGRLHKLRKLGETLVLQVDVLSHLLDVAHSPTIEAKKRQLARWSSGERSFLATRMAEHAAFCKLMKVVDENRNDTDGLGSLLQRVFPQDSSDDSKEASCTPDANTGEPASGNSASSYPHAAEMITDHPLVSNDEVSSNWLTIAVTVQNVGHKETQLSTENWQHGDYHKLVHETILQIRDRMLASKGIENPGSTNYGEVDIISKPRDQPQHTAKTAFNQVNLREALGKLDPKIYSDVSVVAKFPAPPKSDHDDGGLSEVERQITQWLQRFRSS